MKNCDIPPLSACIQPVNLSTVLLRGEERPHKLVIWKQRKWRLPVHFTGLDMIFSSLTTCSFSLLAASIFYITLEKKTPSFCRRLHYVTFPCWGSNVSLHSGTVLWPLALKYCWSRAFGEILGPLFILAYHTFNETIKQVFAYFCLFLCTPSTP